ncbi:gamma carbonic anhydrase family protein [Saxibacter everestensis]|uniref:Gamma carbonic anhydrase family protein n=1 Tax=Saxibacter everestensis TaxID=2909229 RepID=A0ABY8R048_9MICO|nr:gamma carbonic anhydrase family protein [Brevibacteriaceae bacterium ZFBP1038]
MNSTPENLSASLFSVNGTAPVIDETAWVAPGATLIGDVKVGAGSSVFYGVVIRADRAPITIGEGTNLQDGTVMHADPGFPATIGDRVSVGHRALLHGCTVEDDVLVGMSATLLNGSHVGSGSLIAAGAVVLEGTVIPPNSLVAGVPAKVRRELTEEDRERVVQNAVTYQEISALHRDHVRPVTR